MADIISVIVVIVFLVIVFRKRLAPLFGGRKNPGQIQTGETPDDDVTVQVHSPVYYDAVAFDIFLYKNAEMLSKDVAMTMNNRLDYICSKGNVTDVNCIETDIMLLFLIKWQPEAGKRE